MSVVYIYLLFIAAFLVSVTGALFSVTGLSQLFSGAAISVIIMASSLEFSKFIVAGFLYRYWGHIHKPLKAYLIFATVTLMIITSVGIYGYLLSAYQVSSLGLHSHLAEIESLEKENQRIDSQIVELMKFIDEIPNSRISRKFEFQKEYAPKIAELRDQSEILLKEIDEKKLALLNMNTKIGPVTFLAKAFNTDIDKVVQYFILIFVLVFDPLAISLVYSLNLLIRIREKYRGNEFKIGSHAVTSPVDHRYKKTG